MYTLCVSTEILLEYEELLLRITEDKTFTEEVLSAIESAYNVEFVNPVYRFNLIKADPDDNKFVDCAIVANARYIVTNDHHYDILRQIEFPVVDVMALKTFLTLLHSQDSL
jgi:putative PIN family toxin of toxin-antitoxin system